MSPQSRDRIAVVGAGVAGLVAAWLLAKRHDVTLFEKNSRLGGHTNTITITDGPDAGTPVDTGFIVLNDRNYPTFKAFLRELGVGWRDSDMSFGVTCEHTGLQYAGTTLNGLFAQRSNLLKPQFIGMLRDMHRFNRCAREDLANDRLAGLTLGDYIGRLGLGAWFRDYYLLPMGAAIWSSPTATMMEFPAATFVRFFANHGLLTLNDRPQWHTVLGGSCAYVRAFEKQFSGRIVLNAPVKAIRRSTTAATLVLADNRTEDFDHVVVAAHADEAYGMLDDPSALETELLSPWSYTRNPTTLHTDESFLPPLRRAWASWNYRREKTSLAVAPLSVTYHMNRLQGLRTRQQYCVTLNTQQPIPDDRVIARIPYTHPQFSFAAVATQSRLPELNGVRRTWFCGSYFGYGFHEDAVKAGAAVGRAFGVSL